MPIFFPDILQHSNSVNAAIDSNFVRGGIRSSHPDWDALMNTITLGGGGEAGNITDQLKALSSVVWVGDASTGTFYVLTNFAGRDIPYGTEGTGWKKLSEVTGATTTTTLIDSADENANHYLVFANNATGAVSLETDEAIIYNPSTNLLTVTASQANQWTTARTVSFAGGDVTGSFSINGSADVSNVSLTIAANSVELGTDTTGNYVSTLTAGTGVLLTNAQTTSPITETAQYTVALDYVGADSFIGAAAETTEAVVPGDFILIADTSDTGNVKKTALSNLPFTNYSAASITAGTGLIGGGSLTSGGTVTLDLDFSELTDMTGDISGTTEFILLDSGTESRKPANEIKLSYFANNLGWTSNTGSVTSVGLTAGSGITITGTSPITTSGSFEVALTNNSVTIGSTSIALGGTSTSLAGLTGLDFVTDQNAAIASSIGTGVLTIGGSTSAVSVPGALTVGGNLIVNGSTTSVNSTNTNFLDAFIYLNKPTAPLATTATLSYAGIYVYDQTTDNASNIVEANSPGIRYDYNNNKWQLRQDNNANAQDGWVDIITSANQTSLAGASVAETIQGTNTDKYISPNDIRTWTAYNTPNIGITFPESGVSNAAGTTQVQYAKTVKATATVTEADANAGFFSIYHGLGNVYPIVNVYVASGDDYYQVIPKLIVDDENRVKIYIQGMVATHTYYIGITG